MVLPRAREQHVLPSGFDLDELLEGLRPADTMALEGGARVVNACVRFASIAPRSPRSPCLREYTTAGGFENHAQLRLRDRRWRDAPSR